MTEFEFTAVLDRVPDDDEIDRLFECGLDDSTPETRDGRGVLNVHRRAASVAAAIASVVADAGRAGFAVVGLENDDLVSLKTIALRLDRSYESLRLIAAGRRGRGGFPSPLSGDGWSLYSWSLVEDYFARRQGPPSAIPDQRVIAAASLLLQARALVSEPVLDELAPLVHRPDGWGELSA